MKESEKKSISIYLLISYPFKKEEYGEKVEPIFKNKNCENVFTKKIEKDEIISVIHFNLENKKKKKVPELEFELEDNKKEKVEFKLKFDYNYAEKKEVCFIYDLKLYYRKGFGNEKLIAQNLDYTQKMNFFAEFLKQSQQEKRMDDLYIDSIELYSKHPIFQFLIDIFIKIYDNKNVCPSLIKEFKNFNDELTSKLNDPKSRFIDFKDSLKDHINKFKSIIGQSKKLIESNSYNFIEFYGLIFSYLNHYDYEIFMKLFSDLDKSNENKSNLFEILLIYKHFFRNTIKLEKNFLEKFIAYSAESSETNKTNEKNKNNDKKYYFRFIEKALPYINDINIYLHIINKNKEKIVLIQNFQAIEILKFDNYAINFNQFKNDFNEILEFSKNKNLLIVYFNNNFWSRLINSYDEATEKNNIIICKEIRKMFEDYYILIEEICTIKTIKKEAKEFKERDEISNILDSIIINYINNKSDIENDEIINLLIEYDPYYNLENNKESYINKRNPIILEKLNLEKMDNDFIEFYKSKKFEKIFEQQIDDYMLIFNSKIENFSHFRILLNLFDINNIDSKKGDFIGLLEQKYNSLVNKIPNLTNESIKEKESKELIDNLSILLHFFYKESGLESFKKKINILNQHILIVQLYIKLYQIPSNDENIEVKSYIRNNFIKNIKEAQLKNVINFINNLGDEDYLNIMDKLGENYSIKENDFYSSEKSIKIQLLSNLKENSLLKNEKNNYLLQTKEILEKIYKKIDGNNLSIEQLNNLISNNKDKEEIIKKLDLLNLTNNKIAPKFLFNKLNTYQKQISDDIKILEENKSALETYHNTKHKNDIDSIKEMIKSLKEGKIKDYLKKKVSIGKLKDLESKVKKIKEVMNDSLFKIIYSSSLVNKSEEDSRFDSAYEKYNEIKNSNNEEIIAQLINSSDEKNQEEIRKSFIKLGNNKQKDNYSKIFDIKNYEKKINSIFIFFDNFSEYNDKKWKEYLSIKYKDISQKEKKNELLEELKQKQIFDYNQDQKYMEFFTSLCESKESFDYLKNSSANNVRILQEKVEPNNKRLNFKDINDTYECVGTFEKIKNCGDNFEIFEYIKKLDEATINKFKNFVRVYPAIAELNQNFDFSNKHYDEVKNIISKAYFNFNQDNEIFEYYSDTEKKEISISFEGLKNLNNRIHIKKKEITNKKININTEGEKSYEIKYKIITTFKELVDNIESIYINMTILRQKGSILPIMINITIENSKIEYFLASKKVEFSYILKFLLNAKNYLINKLEEIYKNESNLRFFYGKQFVTILRHLSSNHYNIDYFLRYILNISNNSKQIIDGYASNPKETDDYVIEYELYLQNSFDNISNYISSLFKKNDLSYEKHYRKMLIKKNNNLRGIYLYQSELKSSESMEIDILNIFMEYTENLPIAQNILISNKETSYEEMQAFFNRAILCNFNTLFIFEINNSFSNEQRKIMNNLIDKLLTYKNSEYNRKEKDNVEKNKTNEYMDSCLIFIYKKDYSNSFLNEIQNFNPQNFPKITKKCDLNCSFESEFENNQKKLLYENTHIISSEICGLGKSTLIKNEIEKKNKKMIYFPLGGKITRDKIYSKLDEVLRKIKKIKEITKKNGDDIAIYLDLYETEEISILNEFLFSLLITKFYANNENILYMPKNIEIYIEIPNCFNDFLSNYDILNSFSITKINLNKKPDLKLKNLNHFKNMIGATSNKEINDFILKNIKNIGLTRYSYHQINIYINLFVSQYSKFNDKLLFYENGKNVTTECIKKFSEGTKYFINGKYAQLLTKDILEEKNTIKSKSDYIETMTSIYQSDLNLNYSSPLIFTIKEKMKYVELSLSDEGLKKYKNSKDYLEILKYIMQLENPLEKSDDTNNGDNSLISLMEIINKDNYVITHDNFRKMILILYRIIANIPVILMGETGCGKTFLIKKLNHLLNKGEETLKIININPTITDDILIEEMKKINLEASNNKNKDIWIFFDELNTVDSMALITEIFINRSFNAINLEENIKIIGACNPYRYAKEDKIKLGLQHPNEEDEKNKLVYLVNPLPQSLLYYVFNFGYLEENDEKKYISKIINNLFTKEEKELKRITEKIIIECHKHLRETFDPSVVSLREMTRFTKCCEFFLE